MAWEWNSVNTVEVLLPAVWKEGIGKPKTLTSLTISHPHTTKLFMLNVSWILTCYSVSAGYRWLW